MQTDERSLPLKANSDDKAPCPCNACIPRKHYNSETLLTHPREPMYSHNRLFGLAGSQMTMLPFTPIPSSPTAGLIMPYGLHRAPYPRAMFAPDTRYSLTTVEDIAKRDALRESHLIQKPLQPSHDVSRRYWDQPSSSGPHEKPRRMRTVFSPHQLDRLERYFKNQQYVGSAQRIYIASQLGLSETQVKVWFQNRRIRWRKQALTGAKATSPAQES